MDKLLEISKIEVEARERCAFMNVDNPVAKSGLTVSSPEFFPDSRKFTSRGKYQVSASALFTSSNATKSTPYCLFCKQGHYPADCQIVTNLNERRNILKKLGRCFNCMRKGHVSRQCDTSIKCNFCKDKHHAALCLKKFKSVESGCTSKGTTAFAIPEEKVKEEVVEKKGSVGTVGVNNFINSGNHVFLQTAKAMCDSPDNNISRSVRLIFDSASQYTSVTKEVIETLKLKPVRTEKLFLSTFGNEIEEIKTLNVFEVSVRNPKT